MSKVRIRRKYMVGSASDQDSDGGYSMSNQDVEAIRGIMSAIDLATERGMLFEVLYTAFPENNKSPYAPALSAQVVLDRLNVGIGEWDLFPGKTPEETPSAVDLSDREHTLRLINQVSRELARSFPAVRVVLNNVINDLIDTPTPEDEDDSGDPQ